MASIPTSGNLPVQSVRSAVGRRQISHGPVSVDEAPQELNSSLYQGASGELVSLDSLQVAELVRDVK